MLRIGVSGAAGRMGRSVISAICQSADAGLTLSAAIHRPDSNFLGLDAGEMVGARTLGVPIVESIDEAEFDLLIDFTLPNPCLAHVEFCVSNNKPVVIGTTGFSASQLKDITAASRKSQLCLPQI